MQFETTLFVGVVFSCIALPASYQFVNSFQKCVTSTGWKLMGTAIVTHTADDSIPCFYSCVRSSVCYAAYFNNITGICHHHGTNILDLDEGSAEDHVAFVRNIPGIIAGEISRYRYSYQDAVAACASLGGRMMTSQELEALYQNGYEFCRCGWLYEGVIQFPMQTLQPGCGPIGIVSCTNYVTADAWCKV